MIKIYVYPNLLEDERSYFRGKLATDCELIFNAGIDMADEKEQALGAEIIIGNVPAAWVAESRALKFLQLDSVGIDNFAALDWSKLQNRVTACNLAGFFSEPVAEEILSGILMHYRCLPQLATAKEDQQWRKDAIRPQKRLLAGAHVLVFGCGSIGRRVIELLRPFDCRITTLDMAEMTAHGKDGLVAAARQCDILVATVPESNSTRGILDKDVFDAVGNEGLFINCGRGGVVDEPSLLNALRSGALGAAYLDVTCHEPLPNDSPMWICPRLFLSQHTGGGFHDENLAKIDFHVANIRRYINGEPVRNVIDWTRGF